MKRKNLLPLILVTSLFFLWALTSNLIPTLIPHLKKACRLTDFQSAFIDSAYWIAYFVIAIPAGLVMKKFGYKNAIIAGLLIAATGTFLFYPAAEHRTFAFFLGALFIVASGMAFLETAANPYMTILGPPETASQRLNFAQATPCKMQTNSNRLEAAPERCQFARPFGTMTRASRIERDRDTLEDR